MPSFEEFRAAQRPAAANDLERGQALLDLRRYAEAEKLLRQALARDPNNWHGHYLLGAALLSQGSAAPEKIRDGLKEARAAIALRPDQAAGFFLLAWGGLLNRKWDEALAAAQQGLRLDPQHAHGYALAGQAHLAKGEWAKARAAAESGLKLEPATDLLNLHAQSLMLLGEQALARQAAALALHNDPSSSQAHTNRGWLALYDNDPPAALRHFREALRLDPTSQAARGGLVQALHARSPLYRLLLRYYLFTSRLSAEDFWTLAITLSAINSAARSLAAAVPLLWLVVLPYLALYRLFNFFAWVGDAFFNLLLSLSPTGRLVLDHDEKRSALGCGFTGALFLINALALLAALFLARRDPGLLWTFFSGAALALSMLVPLAAIYKVPARAQTRRALLVTFAALLGSTAACAWTSAFFNPLLSLLPAALFVLGSMFYPLAASLIIAVRGD